jgi:hypothetical protein
MAIAMLHTGMSVPKGLESPMKERKVIRIIDIAKRRISYESKRNTREDLCPNGRT